MMSSIPSFGPWLFGFSIVYWNWESRGEKEMPEKVKDAGREKWVSPTICSFQAHEKHSIHDTESVLPEPSEDSGIANNLSP